tara:strand:+ start:910 stop:1050 length:141 start_codon:yes stop_codon:yes gene_type:complete
MNKETLNRLAEPAETALLAISIISTTKTTFKAYGELRTLDGMNTVR